MKKWCLYLVVFLFFSFNASAISSYYSYRMNFPTNEARLHVQSVNASSQLEATIPAGFSFVSCTGGCTNAGNDINWSNVANGIVNYTLQGPSSCTEGTRYTSSLYENSAYQASFVFVCIPDLKVVDYKVEYGHGCGNYLDTDVISNESAMLFNLVRIWNIGNYLSPNEDARNVSINCTFENYPVRTYGRVDIAYNPSSINASFRWARLQGGYWFRIGVLSQDISGKAVGSTYNVSCNPLTYTFLHQKVDAGFSNYTLNIRSYLPFQITAVADASNNGKAIYSVKNNETYNVYDIDINFLVGNNTANSHYALLRPNQSIAFRANAENSTNVTIFFTPEWLVNCFSKKVIGQSIIMNVSNDIFIPTPPRPAGGEIFFAGGAYFPLANVTNITGCNAEITCGGWGNCEEGYISRECYDRNNCNTSAPEKQYASCSEEIENISFKEPSIEAPYAAAVCGNKACEDGEGCTCFSDCRGVSIWWFVLSFIVVALIIPWMFRKHFRITAKDAVIAIALLAFVSFVIYYVYYFGSCFLYMRPLLWLIFMLVLIGAVYALWPKKKKEKHKNRGYY